MTNCSVFQAIEDGEGVIPWCWREQVTISSHLSAVGNSSTPCAKSVNKQTNKPFYHYLRFYIHVCQAELLFRKINEIQQGKVRPLHSSQTLLAG